jgi:hypothetical protein
VQSIEFKATQYHPRPQRVLNAFDHDKQEMRGFAMADMSEVVVLKSDAAATNCTCAASAGEKTCTCK